ncbi:MAG: hypothetical protein OXE83_03840 [Gammaproteobacteria bacterium]|nr:hypothetical protein [Gammaproteobacteria bacterium]
MNKRSWVALIAFGLLSASSALAQPAFFTQTAFAPKFAEEYFGEGKQRGVMLSSLPLADRALVELALPRSGISRGNTADVTFVLNGAQFMGDVSLHSLTARTSCSASAVLNYLSVSRKAGGIDGQNFVTFGVSILDPGTGSGGEAICFHLPDILANPIRLENERKGVTVSVSIDVGTSAGPNYFPTRIQDRVSSQDIRLADRRILDTAPAIAVSVGTGSTAIVSLDDRTVISGGGTDDCNPPDPTNVRTGVQVGALTIGPPVPYERTLRTLTGDYVYLPSSSRQLPPLLSGSVTGFHTSLDGTVEIKVRSSRGFKSGDKVEYCDSGMTVVPGGRDSFEQPIEPIRSGMPIVYVPAEGRMLSLDTITAEATVKLNDPLNDKQIAIASSTGEIEYDGVTVDGYAQGIVKQGGIDRSFLRVHCESIPAGGTGICTVFALCRASNDGKQVQKPNGDSEIANDPEQPPNEFFGRLGDIALGNTSVFSSQHIGDALGGGWENGRGVCDLLSNGKLNVQHMVRAGNVLVNNSYVVGKP